MSELRCGMRVKSFWTHCRIVLPGSHKSKFDRPSYLFDAWSRESGATNLSGSEDWSKIAALAPSAGAHDCTVHEMVANITASAGDVLLLPEATVHGVLPWRARGRRRRIFSMRYHIQHGELRSYREKRGYRCTADFPVRLTCADACWCMRVKFLLYRNGCSSTFRLKR